MHLVAELLVMVFWCFKLTICNLYLFDYAMLQHCFDKRIHVNCIVNIIVNLFGTFSLPLMSVNKIYHITLPIQSVL